MIRPDAVVEQRNGSQWRVIGTFMLRYDAELFLKALLAEWPKVAFRVRECR